MLGKMRQENGKELSLESLTPCPYYVIYRPPGISSGVHMSSWSFVVHGWYCIRISHDTVVTRTRSVRLGMLKARGRDLCKCLIFRCMRAYLLGGCCYRTLSATVCFPSDSYCGRRGRLQKGCRYGEWIVGSVRSQGRDVFVPRESAWGFALFIS